MGGDSRVPLMENETWTGASLAVKLAEGFFPLFYVLPPSWSSFATVAEVPDYVSKVLNEFLIETNIRVCI